MSWLLLTVGLPVQAAVAGQDNGLGGPEAALFWILAPIMVIAALGLLFARKAVHAAMMLALVMICLAVLYFAQGAPFLGAAQVIVYTGAVMMLFLFVLMLVGVDSSDSLIETIKGQRVVAVLAGLGIGIFLVSTVTGFFGGRFGLERLQFPAPAGLTEANAGGNPQAVARVLFSDYFVAMELTGGLLITAAVAAIVLTHRERLVPRVTQRTLQARRVLENRHVAGLPPPGVFARHNAVDTPALLPDGTPSELSVNRVLRARGQELSPTGLRTAIREITADIEGRAPKGMDDVGDHMDRGLTGTQLPDDERVDGTGRMAEPPVDPEVLQQKAAGQAGDGDEPRGDQPRSGGTAG